MREEKPMAFAAGSVVVLKSGGLLMTVVSASDDEIECVWLGDEGELFRHSIPAIALEAAPVADHDDDEEEEEEEDDGAEDEEDEEDDTPKKGRAA
jgi:uncharacterized protein YodC (DUF2158 family)